MCGPVAPSPRKRELRGGQSRELPWRLRNCANRDGRCCATNGRRTSLEPARPSLERDASGFEDFAENCVSLLGSFLGGNVARADDHAVGEGRDDEALEVVGQAEVAAFKERAGLRRTLQHHGAARANTQTQLLGLTRAVDNLQGVVEKA